MGWGSVLGWGRGVGWGGGVSLAGGGGWGGECPWLGEGVGWRYICVQCWCLLPVCECGHWLSPGSSSRLLRHRDVILKKVKRSEAERAVMDVTLYRKSDKPSSLYTKIG